MSGILDLDVLLGADGSQIEIRALAELSQDKLLVKQLQDAALDRRNRAKDIHCQVGHTLTGRSMESIAHDKPVRRMCKALHFGVVFGLSEQNIYGNTVAQIRAREGPSADLTGITKNGMIKLHRAYFKKYAGVKRFQDECRAFVKKHGYIDSLFGFRRIVRTDNTSGSYWGNQAINSPVQGTAHQFLLIALALLDLKPKTYSLLQRCIMEVHDALYFLVKLRDLSEAYKQLMHLFEVGAWSYAAREFKLDLKVPLLAEASAGFTMASLIGPDEEYFGESVDEFLPKWRAKQREVDAKDWNSLMPAVVPV